MSTIRKTVVFLIEGNRSQGFRTGGYLAIIHVNIDVFLFGAKSCNGCAMNQTIFFRGIDFDRFAVSRVFAVKAYLHAERLVGCSGSSECTDRENSTENKSNGQYSWDDWCPCFFISIFLCDNQSASADEIPGL